MRRTSQSRTRASSVLAAASRRPFGAYATEVSGLVKSVRTFSGRCQTRTLPSACGGGEGAAVRGERDIDDGLPLMADHGPAHGTRPLAVARVPQP